MILRYSRQIRSIPRIPKPQLTMDHCVYSLVQIHTQYKQKFLPKAPKSKGMYLGQYVFYAANNKGCLYLQKQKYSCFTDPYMDLIYSILFISGLTSVLAMELCVICLNNYTGSHNRSSPLSLSIITAFLVQMILDMILPKVIQGTQYYVAKMFIAVLVNISMSCPFMVQLEVTETLLLEKPHCHSPFTNVFSALRYIVKCLSQSTNVETSNIHCNT